MVWVSVDMQVGDMTTLEQLKLELWLRMRDRGVIQWTTKDGKQIPFKDLSDSHLLNIINMLEKKEDEEWEYWEAYDPDALQ